MLVSPRWQSQTALIMALGITVTSVTPILMANPATATPQSYTVAQGRRFPRQRPPISQQSTRVIVPSGTLIRVKSEEAEKIVVMPDETAPVTLTTTRDIRSSSGTILIPAGSTIEGELRPVSRGTQFFAKNLIVKNTNRVIPLNAKSQVITETETIKKGTDVSSILKGAAIGAAAAAVLSEVFGDIDLIEVLAGGGLGALGGLLLGGKKEVDVFVVYPESDLGLTLQSDLLLN